ncbi:23S rRNA (uracil(1939)-C(5))-methyltransferase RlmD [Clostridium botulinum D/C]|uniref:RNA methyltransferase n=2 Tax=Clostridium botulinum TaxID=1491 RepID=A0A0A0IHG6_CLOBO|nr:23S rRNA (uracil(1939)-C(5))-methyltransferase RlmD [Clostridium botulinum]KGN00428.1 RNA methyltransferase [Clostridium botulinum C/D str. DC5]MCD3233568.1 23S rRNA (uracil(1939)-C(5))-methyltransferase RlmD [Clostridium botulinum D/C]MCD3239318.1 23S rRNA (uracil(1939)-C(5))-methyltransferase RlmD [Clostridium botulinum D/C]MCD3266990.1 23S rRNA (uracil(1939)-C(5))-methyltransferase RlmD [Clostridium botulinum D/C]MCD3298857.1 23S rRNA (uracil(1939)-C(5))-methyltransferase RlmD [Clostridi
MITLLKKQFIIYKRIKRYRKVEDLMNKIIPVEKNKEYIVEILSLGFEGEGIAKIDNYAIFIPEAMIGEKVKIKIVKVKKNFAYGKLIEILETSKNREIPVCDIYTRCGGCSIQHFNYDAQLEFKKNRVKDCLERIGKLQVITKEEKNISYLDNKSAILHDTLGMENPYRYRNKVQLPVGEENGEIKIGFYAPRSHDIIDMDICNIQDEVGDKVVTIIKEWMKNYNIKPYNEEKNTGFIRHIMVRRGFNTNEVMVVIVTRTNELPYKEELIELILKNIDGVTSIVQNINSKKTNVVLGLNNITLYGKDYISDYIGEFKFNISPLSFFQVNPIQTEVLYNKALEYAALTGNEVVFDAYCGTGTISLFLSKNAKKVYGVEIVEDAIENAKINAKENNVNNAEFIVGKSEEVIPNLIKQGIKADVVVVDPPRKGCDKSLLDAIGNMKPDRIVYVSCDPGTLARDLAILDELGYATKEVQPVDMFPQTGHVENVVLLTRED